MLTLATILRRITMSDERGTTFRSVDEYRSYMTATVYALKKIREYVRRVVSQLSTVMMMIVTVLNTVLGRPPRAERRPGGRTPRRILAGGVRHGIQWYVHRIAHERSQPILAQKKPRGVIRWCDPGCEDDVLR